MITVNFVWAHNLHIGGYNSNNPNLIYLSGDYEVNYGLGSVGMHHFVGEFDYTTTSAKKLNQKIVEFIIADALTNGFEAVASSLFFQPVDIG